MRSRRPEAAHRRGAADGLDLDVRQRVRGCQARDDRDAQAGRRERLDGYVVVGGQATRGSNPAARQVCRTMRNQVLAASVNTNWAFSTSACGYEESPFSAVVLPAAIVFPASGLTALPRRYRAQLVSPPRGGASGGPSSSRVPVRRWRLPSPVYPSVSSPRHRAGQCRWRCGSRRSRGVRRRCRLRRACAG
jgi:hypothetical protein